MTTRHARAQQGHQLGLVGHDGNLRAHQDLGDLLVRVGANVVGPGRGNRQEQQREQGSREQPEETRFHDVLLGGMELDHWTTSTPTKCRFPLKLH